MITLLGCLTVKISGRKRAALFWVCWRSKPKLPCCKRFGCGFRERHSVGQSLVLFSSTSLTSVSVKRRRVRECFTEERRPVHPTISFLCFLGMKVFLSFATPLAGEFQSNARHWPPQSSGKNPEPDTCVCSTCHALLFKLTIICNCHHVMLHKSDDGRSV